MQTPASRMPFPRLGLAVGIPDTLPYFLCLSVLHREEAPWLGRGPGGNLSRWYLPSSHSEEKGHGKNAQEMGCAAFFH